MNGWRDLLTGLMAILAAPPETPSSSPAAPVGDSSPRSVPLYVPALRSPAAADDQPGDSSLVTRGNHRLRRTKSGEYEYEDSRFSAQIRRDGSVLFADKKISVLSNIERMLDARELQAWRMREERPRISPLRPDATVDARSQRDDPLFEQHQSGRGTSGVLIPQSGIASLSPLIPQILGGRGTLDLNDALMRARGQDPYAAHKGRFLAATLDLRTGLAVEARKEEWRNALYNLSTLIDRIWSDERFSQEERRRILQLISQDFKEGEAGGPEASATIDRFLLRHPSPPSQSKPP